MRGNGYEADAGERAMGRWFYVFVVVLLMYGNYSVAIITRGVLA